MKDKDNAIVDFVYMNVREYTGVDLDGVIAIPRAEIREKLNKEIQDAQSDPSRGSFLRHHSNSSR